MKHLSGTAVLVSAIAAFALPAHLAAQAYPARTVRVVVPFPAGGGTDIDRDALVPIGGTPEELSAHLKSEIARYGEVIRKGNITLQ